MAKRAVKRKGATAKPKATTRSVARAAKKSPAKPSATSASAADSITAAVAALNGAIAGDRLDQLPPALVQKLMAAAIRAYSAKVQTGEGFLPFHPSAGRVSPTDVMITSSGLLKAANLQVFELGMWQSYTGR